MNGLTDIKESVRQREYIDRIAGLVRDRGLKYLVVTFGCQMNERDSEKIAGSLEEMGYTKAMEESEADILVYNTCTVRENAAVRLYGRLGAAKSYKEKNKDMLIAICGCLMQEEHAVEKIKKSYPFVDIIFGTHNIFRFPELLYKRLESSESIADIWECGDRIVEDLPVRRKYDFKMGINIMYGCDNFCTYCKVPYVRGRERSRDPKEIIREIESCVEDGVVEVMLLGQNVNSYGKGLDTKTDFPMLLEEVCRIDGLKRVRFMTSHPKDLSDSLIRVIAENPKIARHIHLPLQAGSDRILKAMNRHYTKEDYISLALRIKQEIEDVSLTSDIMVGFPHETESDVDETIDVIERVRYDGAFTFEYSPRKGTPAAEMEQLDKEYVQKNFDRVLKCVQKVSKEQAKRFEGRTMEVLTEGVDEKDPERFTGRLSQNSVVHYPMEGHKVGDMVRVRLDECMGFYYNGHIVD